MKYTVYISPLPETSPWKGAMSATPSEGAHTLTFEADHDGAAYKFCQETFFPVDGRGLKGKAVIRNCRPKKPIGNQNPLTTVINLENVGEVVKTSIHEALSLVPQLTRDGDRYRLNREHLQPKERGGPVKLVGSSETLNTDPAQAQADLLEMYPHDQGDVPVQEDKAMYRTSPPPYQEEVG